MSEHTPQSRLSCLIIDDEEPAHKVLRFHIQHINWLYNLGSLYNAVDALTQIPALMPDIIFLDVSMPHLNGLKLLDLLPIDQSPGIILCSAHSQYALDGYDYEVSSFLLKPVTFDKFLRAVNKIRLRRQKGIADSDSDPSASLPTYYKKPPAARTTVEEQFSPFFSQEAVWVKSDKKQLKIYFDEIKFIEAQRNYVKIYYSSKLEVVTRASLTEMELNLPPQKFVRTHKSYIVNRRAVTEIDGNTITLDNNYRVSISQKERNEICRRLTL